MSNTTLSASLRRRGAVTYGARPTDGGAISNSTVKYSTIIDAGSSGSRIYVYKWETGDNDNPLVVTKVFPSKATSAQAVKDGGMSPYLPLQNPCSSITLGIQTKGQDQQTMDGYLGPLLRAAEQFLTTELPNGNHTITAHIPIYLIATGGMRSIPKADQDRILDMAYTLIKTFGNTFNAGHRETTVRVIPGELEGLFSWVALNYARQSTDDPLLGLTEMGGASTQFAFEDHSDQVANKTRVCLPSKSDGYDVYSSTWDGYGADTMRANMLQLLSNDAGPEPLVFNNPCLPLGETGKPFGTATRSSVGTGEFKACLAVAKRLLVEGAKTRGPIPSYSAIRPTTSTNNVLGLSNYWYSYQFFGQYGPYDINSPYDPVPFEAAVEKYCSHKWGTLAAPDDKFSEGRCFSAAWMLTLLHDKEQGFGLDPAEYETWKGFVEFPTTSELTERASWTSGVASLIAQHGGLVFCSGDDELVVARSHIPSLHYRRELPEILPPRIQLISGHDNGTMSSSQVTGELGLSLPPVTGCGVVFLLLFAMFVFALRLIASGKARVRTDVEVGYPEEGTQKTDSRHGL